MSKQHRPQQQHQTPATDTDVEQPAPECVEVDPAIRAQIQSVSTLVSGVSGVLATVMAQSQAAGAAIGSADIGGFTAGGTGASSAAASARSTIDGASGKLDGLGAEEGAQGTPEWAKALSDIEAAEGELSSAGAAAIGFFAIPGGQAAAGEGDPASAIAGAMGAAMPEVASASMIKGAAVATAGLIGPEAAGAAQGLKILLDAHPGSRAYAEGILNANAGSEVLAAMNGGAMILDGDPTFDDDTLIAGEEDVESGTDDALEAAKDEAQSGSPNVSGSAKTGADAKVPSEQRVGEGEQTESKTERDGAGGKKTTTTKTWKEDGSGTTNTTTTKGGVSKDGASVSRTEQESAWGEKGSKAGYDTKSTTSASTDGKKVSLSKDRTTTTIDDKGNKKVKTGALSADTDGKVSAKAGVGGTTESGLDVGVSGSGSADFKMNEDGTIGLDGVSIAVTTKVGPVNVSGQVSYQDKLTGPIAQGEQFMVTATRTFTVGGGFGASGKSGGAGMSASQTETFSATQLFPTAEAAKAMVDSGQGPASMPSTPSIVAPDLEQMKEGETITMSSGTDFGLDGSVSGNGVTAKASGTVGTGKQVQVTKGANGTVEVTVMDLENSGVSGGVSAGVGVKGNLGKGKAAHTSVKFDLSTEEGKEAYARWSKNPEAVPSGKGATKTSSGSGSVVRSGHGIDAVVGTAGDVSETGRYDEELADGRKQTTWYGNRETHARTDVPVYGNVEDDKRKYGLTIRKTEGKDGDAKTTFTLRSEVKAGDAAASQDALADAEGKRHTKDAYAEGDANAYTVEEEVSQDDMDTFVEAVRNGSYKPDVGDDALQQQLAEAGDDEDQRNAVLTQYFADKGPDAIKALKGCPGVEGGKRDYSIDGDEYLTGKIGRQRLTAEIDAVRKRIGSGEDIDGVQAAARALLGKCEGRRAQVINPGNYTDLPDAARREIIAEIDEDRRRIKRLIYDIEKVRCHQNDEIPPKSTRDAVEHAEGRVARARTICETKMGNAEIDRRLLRNGGSGSVRGKYALKGGFEGADKHWNEAQKLYANAQKAYAAFTAVDPFCEGGESAAVSAAKTAETAYVEAGAKFGAARISYRSLVDSAREKGMLDTSSAEPIWLPVADPTE